MSDENECLKYHKVVEDIIDSVQDIVTEKIKEAKINPQEAWLVYGRVISFLFTEHYGLSIDIAKKKDKEVRDDHWKTTKDAAEEYLANEDLNPSTISDRLVKSFLAGQKLERKHSKGLRDAVNTVYESLEHGNKEHRAWLKKKFDDHFRKALADYESEDNQDIR